MGMLSKIGTTVAAVALTAGATSFASPAAQAHDGTPCGARADACLDLSSSQAWLMSNGEVTYGPVPMSSGKPGYETPTGMFHVTWKNRDHWSQTYDAPMPYSVFFTNNGHAIHEGNIERGSHGCVRLRHAAAKKFFAELEPRDHVQITW
ncbi:L,D-transpeptidase [Haloechinothrix halophila]|uniref:L,D-transpeptidase n=1 Tax=Haloechinothrix halophila TaxID=1069073 RepID=UPI001E417727|nr:L,D-transpeptidase [Haloechinothrix halophila]